MGRQTDEKGNMSTNKNLTLERAKERAAKLGYPELSMGAHMRHRKLAQQGHKSSNAPAGKQQAPEQCWMGFSTGKFFTELESGNPGTQVAAYRRAAVGPIKMIGPEEEAQPQAGQDGKV